MIIPDGVREIGEQWFKNSDIESITIPASVTNLKQEAFCDCKKLR